jgi:hypothetical protein
LKNRTEFRAFFSSAKFVKASSIFRKTSVYVFFIILFFVGLIVFKDYGVSWDEPIQRQYGINVYEYVFHGDKALLSDRHRYYGPVFELFLVTIEKFFHVNKVREVFLLRHFINYCVFYLGALFFYLLSKKLFNRRLYGVLAVLGLLLCPRIFAHSFFNSKDLPFLAFFIIAIYTLFCFLEKKNIGCAVGHALACALVADIRVLGGLVVVITVLYVLAEIIRKEECRSFRYLSLIGGYFISYFFFLILFWPFLWHSPVKNLILSLVHMSHFPWYATVLYLGEYLKSTELPWHYPFVWMGITIPISIILLFFLGVVFPEAKTRYRVKRIALLWVGLPLIIVVALKPVLYDGWRHLFFVYPGIVLLSLLGFRKLVEFCKNEMKLVKVVGCILICLVLINVTSVLVFSVRYHPNQQVYFNCFAGSWQRIKDRFEMDYWGVSYKQCLERLLVQNDSEIFICSDNFPGIANSYIFKEKERDRLKYLNSFKGARYFITNYRWHSYGFPWKREYSVLVKGVPISSVYSF